MVRSELGLVATVVGGALTALGTVGYAPAWVFLVGGAVVALCGLLSVGGPGWWALSIVGGWIFLSVLVVDAGHQWNLLVSGLTVVGCGFWSGAAGARPPAVEERLGSGG